MLRGANELFSKQYFSSTSIHENLNSFASAPRHSSGIININKHLEKILLNNSIKFSGHGERQGERAAIEGNVIKEDTR